LNLLVKQRDQEIGIMLQYLNKKKGQEAALNNSDIAVQRPKELGDTNSSAFANGA
jgi:hypothetical protein